jgi:TPR repeat protein
VQPQSWARATLTNEGFDWFYAQRFRSGPARASLVVPRAVSTCDRLASLGIDNPDSSASRVPRDEIKVSEAVPACVAAILQEPAVPRLRLQLARALLAAGGKSKKDKLINKIGGLSILHDLAVDGYPAAMWQVAIHYYREKNLQRAAVWFRKAAEKGLAVAMSDLGYLYENGEGVPKDAAEAVRWFERSAAGGHPGGMRNFAFVLDQGMGGVERDSVRSADFLLTAFRMGSESARRSLFELHASWSRETRAEVQRLLEAYGFYRGAVDGNFEAPTFAALAAFAQQNPSRAAP